jgi:O-antigen/teichoic acid export membrane protein
LSLVEESPVEAFPVAEQPETVSESIGQRIWHAGLWVIGCRMLTLICTLLVQVLLSRYLTPAEYGLFGCFTAYAVFVSILMMFGMNSALVRLIAERMAVGAVVQAKNILQRGMLWSALSTVVICTVLLSMNWLISGELGEQTGIGVSIKSFIRDLLSRINIPNSLVTWIVAAAVLMTIQQILAEILRALHYLKTASLFIGGQTNGTVTSMLFLCITFGIGVYFKYSDTSGIGFVFENALWAQLIALAISLPLVIVVFVFIYRRVFAASSMTSDATTQLTAGQQLAIGLPLMLIMLSHFIQGFSDVPISRANFTNPDEVGYYQAARFIINLVTMPIHLVNLTISASIVQLHAQGRRMELQQLLTRSAAFAGLPSLFAVAILAIMPEVVLQIYGEQYIPAAPALRWLAIGNVPFILSGSAGISLIMLGYERISLILSVTSAALLIVAGNWSAAQYGLLGLVVASSLATFVQALGHWWVVWQKQQYWTHFQIKPWMDYMFRKN